MNIFLEVLKPINRRIFFKKIHWNNQKYPIIGFPNTKKKFKFGSAPNILQHTTVKMPLNISNSITKQPLCDSSALRTNIVRLSCGTEYTELLEHTRTSVKLFVFCVEWRRSHTENTTPKLSNSAHNPNKNERMLYTHHKQTG